MTASQKILDCNYYQRARFKSAAELCDEWYLSQM